MIDAKHFAVLVSQITVLRGSRLTPWEINDLSETVNGFGGRRQQSIASIGSWLAWLS